MRVLSSLAVAVLFLAANSPNTVAQQHTSNKPCNGPCHDDREVLEKEITPENFSEMRSRLLAMIEKRRTKLDSEKACLEAAKNAEALKKCRPEQSMGKNCDKHENGPCKMHGGEEGYK